MHWLLCRLRNAWTAKEWWCAPQRSDERDAVSMQREQHYYPLSLSLSLTSYTHAHTHVLVHADARTCLLNSHSQTHSFPWFSLHADTQQASVAGLTFLSVVSIFSGLSQWWFPFTSCLPDGCKEKQQLINKPTLMYPIFMGTFSSSTGNNASYVAPVAGF